MAGDEDGYPGNVPVNIWLNHVERDFIRATIRDKLSVPDEQINCRF